jgi:hypothetical protein
MRIRLGDGLDETDVQTAVSVYERSNLARRLGGSAVTLCGAGHRPFVAVRTTGGTQSSTWTKRSNDPPSRSTTARSEYR